MADNCEPRSISSNSTGLAYAETICGRLPTIELDGYLPTWRELEPNGFRDFGADIKTTARKPLSASRQNKKGVVTDLDASGGFDSDYTQNNLNRLLQGFFFADVHEKATTEPTNGGVVVVDSAALSGNTYAAAGGGLSRFRASQLVVVTGFENAANNGLKRVVTVSDTAITVDTVLADETAPDGVVIEAVGFQLPNAGASIALVGALARLTLAANPVGAAGTVTFSGPGSDGDTITVGGIVYTLRTVADDPYEVAIGGTATATAAGLVASIVGNNLTTPAHPRVTASNVAGVVTVTAKVKGTSGNGITLAKAGTAIAVSGATLAGGSGFSLLELGLINGEWLFLGGDAVGNKFANNTGYARVSTISDTTFLFDKTTWVPQAEAGTGKDIRVFIGNILVNEKDPEKVVTRYYEFERTLGKDEDGLQAEYLTRSVPNTLTLNMPVTDKITAEVTYVSGDVETRTGDEGLKDGSKVAALSEDAYNTTSNVVRMRMAVIDPATSRPLPLYAYVTDATLAIDNHLSGIKAIANLGSVDVSVGDFEVKGTVTALFQSVRATRAVRDNADVTFDIICAAGNHGFVYDIPLLSLGGARP
jgi:hypothetical protein